MDELQTEMLSCPVVLTYANDQASCETYSNFPFVCVLQDIRVSIWHLFKDTWLLLSTC